MIDVLNSRFLLLDKIKLGIICLSGTGICLHYQGKKVTVQKPLIDDGFRRKIQSFEREHPFAKKISRGFFLRTRKVLNRYEINLKREDTSWECFIIDF